VAEASTSAVIIEWDAVVVEIESGGEAEVTEVSSQVGFKPNGERRLKVTDLKRVLASSHVGMPGFLLWIISIIPSN